MATEPTSKDLVVADEVVEGEIVEEVDDNPAREARLAELEARRTQSMLIGQINNSELYAGSPMYYYCIYCGVQTDVKPETWFLHPPKEVCDDCNSLIRLGWHDGVMPEFPMRP